MAEASVENKRKHFLRFKEGNFLGYAFAEGPHEIFDAGEKWIECDADVIQNLQRGFPYRINAAGTGVEIRPITNEELAQQARVRRNRLLAASDYTQVIDYPMSDELREQWAAYRQELRDLTELAGFPNAFLWPKSPDEKAAETTAG